MRQPRININWYIFSDVLISIITWITFYYLRSVVYNFHFSIPAGFYLGMLLYTLGWIFLNFISGMYGSLYEKSRFNEIIKTFFICLTGCLFLLFFFILKNPHADNLKYYQEFFILLGPITFLTILVRMAFLNKVKNQLNKKSVFFNVLLIGSIKKAEEFYNNFIINKEQGGYKVVAFFSINDEEKRNLNLKTYPKNKILKQIIKEENIEQVIIAVDKKDRELLSSILENLSTEEVGIKIIPDMVDIISGALQTNNVTGVPLIEIHPGKLNSWQVNVKRLLDIVISVPALLLTSPFLLYILLRVKNSSEGPVFFKQERLGYKCRPFTMYKFRSMYIDAESHGPQLSSENDPRITKWGKVMRKWRIDELPQLWNILIGDMSFVGPRPERKFYYDKIVKSNPEFKYLFKVKPGLTSWGMVKFGYASSIEEMIERLPYDLMYVENVSLALDFKIMFYSIQIILAGKGK